MTWNNSMSAESSSLCSRANWKSFSWDLSYLRRFSVSWRIFHNFSFFLASQKQNLLTHIEASYFFSEAVGGGATKALVFVLIHNHPTHLRLDELLVRSQSWVKIRKLLMLYGVVDSSSMGKSSWASLIFPHPWSCIQSENNFRLAVYQIREDSHHHPAMSASHANLNIIKMH